MKPLEFPKLSPAQEGLIVFLQSMTTDDLVQLAESQKALPGEMQNFIGREIGRRYAQISKDLTTHKSAVERLERQRDKITALPFVVPVC